MPSWGTILKEIQESAAQRGQLGPDVDGIRLKYIQRLRDHSKRAVIVYASGWLRSGGREDLDYSAEQMVNYLRTQFDYIRALVPLQAKSAATMIALGCDEIVMGRHSELGPIDPQILVPVPGGARFAPAHAILRDFERAKREIAEDVNSLAAWTPILHAYAGGLLEFCTQQIKLSQEIVAGWLKQHMLRHDDVGIEPGERDEIANRIADYFGSEASYDRFRTHGRPIRIEELEAIQGLRVRRLEADDGLQDALARTLAVPGGPERAPTVRRTRLSCEGRADFGASRVRKALCPWAVRAARAQRYEASSSEAAQPLLCGLRGRERAAHIRALDQHERTGSAQGVPGPRAAALVPGQL